MGIVIIGLYRNGKMDGALVGMGISFFFGCCFRTFFGGSVRKKVCFGRVFLDM